MTLSDTTRNQIRTLRADGYTGRQVAEVIGCSSTTVLTLAPGWPGKVPNDRLREAFLESGLTAATVARRVGWMSNSRGTRADSSRVNRTLGLADDTNGRGAKSRRKMIDWETGSLIAEAIGVAPWSVLDDDLEDAA